jgi:hypothetical protein
LIVPAAVRCFAQFQPSHAENCAMAKGMRRCWGSLLALAAVAAIATPACDGRDHLEKHDARGEGGGPEKPLVEVGSPTDATDTVDASSVSDVGPSDIAEAPADVPIETAPEAPPEAAPEVHPDIVSSSDVPVDNHDAGGAGSTATGKSCQRDTDCTSGHCREGVCCDAACSDKCRSCLKASTGQPDGTCAPVKNGVSHGSDCAPSDPTSCGLDGTCDGAGACRRHIAGTICEAESCVDAATLSTYTPPRKCNGGGVCAVAETSNCGSTYRCSGTKCRATCTTSQDCVSGAYCSGSSCATKKPDGDLCASNGECVTGACGGRCCAAGCTCTQPTTGNLLKNPGFDKDTEDWTIDQGKLSRIGYDAEQCPYSGSLEVTIPAGGAERTVSQCVKNVPLSGIVNFGARLMMVGGNAMSLICQISVWSGFNCDADQIYQNETSQITPMSGWQSPGTDAQPAFLTGGNSVSVTCYLIPDPSGQSDFYVDMAYVAKAPNRY